MRPVLEVNLRLRTIHPTARRHPDNTKPRPPAGGADRKDRRMAQGLNTVSRKRKPALLSQPRISIAVPQAKPRPVGEASPRGQWVALRLPPIAPRQYSGATESYTPDTHTAMVTVDQPSRLQGSSNSAQ